MKDKIIFEIITKHGHKYKAFLSGKTEGFPDDALIINHAAPLFAELSTLANRPNVQASTGANQEPKVVA